jgi:hypothetical protein
VSAWPYVLANGFWLGSGAWQAWDFQHSLNKPRERQWILLRSMLANNAESEYGRRYQFNRIDSISKFQQIVPPVTYEDLRGDIEAIKRGKQGVLTTEPVLMFEKTTGSTAAAKYIPYTASLRRQFQAAIAPWMLDLYRNHPSMALGGAYWSISPAASMREVTEGGLSVGFDNDSDYFGRFSRYWLKRLFLLPPEIAQLSTIDAIRYATLRFLLPNSNLRFVSVWNPSFFTLLIEYMDQHAKRLIADIRNGTLTFPTPVDADLKGKLAKDLSPQPSRAAQLEAVLQGNLSLCPSKVWPHLSVISCWTSANAKWFVDDLHKRFPQVEIQPKGLLATEGVVSIPIAKQSGGVLAVTSHFMEFVDENNPCAKPLLVDELKTGSIYTVLITTGGGLYRYALGDRVQVTGFLAQTPIVEFIGKGENISDLCGEKLNETFVTNVIEKALAVHDIKPSFVMMAPERNSPPGYVLFIESVPMINSLIAISYFIERALVENPHYAYCRRLGQLRPLNVYLVKSGAAETYLKRSVAMGQKIGTVKPKILHRECGWSEWFNGAFLETALVGHT